jgi:hypothetical protein
MHVCCEPVLREHPALAPSAAARERQADLDPVPASVGQARSLVWESMAGFDGDARDVALLLTSELVTNAILHARTPVHLGVLVDGDRALVCVADRLPESPALSARAHSHDRPGGRGFGAGRGSRRHLGDHDVHGWQDRVVRPADRWGPVNEDPLMGRRPRNDHGSVIAAAGPR